MYKNIVPFTFENKSLRRGLYYCFTVFFIISFTTTTGYCQTTTLPPAAQEAINKGIVAAKIPDYPLAVTYFQEARKAAPQSAEIFFYLGLAESNIPGRELRAICWFGAYLAANPTAANATAVREQINTLDVKNRSSVIRLLNMVQDAMIPLLSEKLWYAPDRINLVKLWLEMSDVSAATKAANSVDKKGENSEFYRNIALIYIVTAQLEANDLEGAKKTTNQISYNREHSRGLYMIANYQLIKADTATAQKTLAAAFKIGAKIHSDPSLGITTMESAEIEQLTVVAGAQARAGDIIGAKKTAEFTHDPETIRIITSTIASFAQAKTMDTIAVQKTLKTAQKPIELIKVADWLIKLDDSNEIDDCPLNTEPFLDLDSLLKTAARSDDPGVVLVGIKKAVEKIVKARNIVLQLLKDQAGK